jgi:hypothetical protein
VKFDVTEVERLTLQSGDRLIVHVEQLVSAEHADHVEQIVRNRLQLPADVPVLVLGPGMSLAVVTP